MAAHLLVIYPTPRDKADFERAYRDEHLPYAGRRLVGAASVVSKRVVALDLAPTPHHWMLDVAFPTLDALKAWVFCERGWEALSHATSISSGGTPHIFVVEDVG